MPSLRVLRARAPLLGVPGSQIAMAAGSYVVLVLAARAVPASSFTAISTFYLLMNTVGRGTFAAVELELTRAVAAARAVGDTGHRASSEVLRRTLGLVLVAVVLIVGCSPLLLTVVGGAPATVGLLAFGCVAMAGASFLRGPLAALGRYTAYASTFVAEAVACAGLGLALWVGGSQSTTAWVLPFVAGPVAACLVVGSVAIRSTTARAVLTGARRPDSRTERSTAVSTAALLWSAVLFLASQGVWNLGAVVVSARAVATPALAAGFVAASVVIRAPVLAFPAVQALLLPSVTVEAQRGGRGHLARLVRRIAPLVVAAAALWMLGAIFVLPFLTRTLFDLEAPSLPVVATLAASALLGATTQLGQTQLIARRQHRGVALAWTVGLTLLLAIAAGPLPPDQAGALAQIVAVGAVVIFMTILLKRSSARM